MTSFKTLQYVVFNKSMSNFSAAYQDLALNPSVLSLPCHSSLVLVFMSLLCFNNFFKPGSCVLMVLEREKSVAPFPKPFSHSGACTKALPPHPSEVLKFLVLIAEGSGTENTTQTELAKGSLNVQLSSAIPWLREVWVTRVDIVLRGSLEDQGKRNTAAGC